MHPKDIAILGYTYPLPDHRIASMPLANRDESKLLIYKEGVIAEDQYKHLAAHLPANSLLVFNNTRVIQARLLFEKTTGGIIELFCLEPYESVNDYSIIMAQTAQVRWKCLIGGASKWKAGPLIKSLTINGTEYTLTANLLEKLSDAYVVQLQWAPSELSFAEIIEKMGVIPLPPYIKRKAGDADKERYQTIYAKYDGSVAAPTAGLHFTPALFASLDQRKVHQAYVTLHVGAGTFKPVKAQQMADHQMHAEWIDVGAPAIHQIIEYLPHGIFPVGTTSLRTLESLYWMGVKVTINPAISAEELPIQQWDVYEPPLNTAAIEPKAALLALLNWMQQHGTTQLFTHTQILIAPGYKYQLPTGIITNFHQPQSTLLLLVAAAIGADWKKVYEYALQHDFRFLSYGDGSLLYLSPNN